MLLKGSCHCRAVTFEVEAAHPYPFCLCYCAICRKTAGGGGFAINLGAEAATLKVTGAEHVRTYRARIADPETGEETLSQAERKFCVHCGSALWVWDPRWPDHLHPHASAIDSDLPVPPERTHLMLGSKAGWVQPCLGDGDRTFDLYPDESLADWHRRLHLER
jgi:hypothetical protein